MVNILVEGCDGSGKTSMIEALIKLDSKFTYVHLEAPKSYDDAKRMYVLMLARLWSEDNLIYDRAHLSELVYSPLKRGYTPYYIGGLEQLMPDNTLLIVMDAELDTLVKRYDGKFISVEELPQLKNAYKMAFEHTLLKNKKLVMSDSESPIQLAYQVWWWAHYSEDPLSRPEV